MNSVVTQRHPHQDPSSTSRHSQDDLRQAVSAAHSILDQTPPPSLREILTAYRNKGDGDRDMLLAMLNAKTAEDQRIASSASLQRSVITLLQHPSEPLQTQQRSIDIAYHYPPPPFVTTSHPSPCDQRPSRRTYNHRARSSSRSPPRVQAHLPLPPRDVVMSHHSEHPRKRHRSSRSPHQGLYESSHPSEQFPPSPYSSSDRSDSAEYSPRSRASMAIGSLLSAGPRREPNGDGLYQERD